MQYAKEVKLDKGSMIKRLNYCRVYLTSLTKPAQIREIQQVKVS